MRPSLLAAVVCAIALHVQAADPHPWKTDYETLQKWQYSTDAIPIAQPITITRDTATWTLTSGTVHLAQPTSSGRTTGLLFEGEGRFTMTIPDRFELAQLRRFAEKPELQSIDEPFSQAVFRVSDDTIDKLFPNATRGTYTQNAIAEKRENHWLIDLKTDVDARIVTAMANGGLRMTVGMKTKDFDWLTYGYDSAAAEETGLTRWNRGYPESWLSLDRADDRAPDGRPGPRDRVLANLSHIDVKADLTKRSMVDRAGATNQRAIWGHYVVAEDLTPLADGVVALPLTLHPMAQNLTVTDETGAVLDVLRDHIGARSLNVERKFYDPILTIMFPKPLAKNEKRTLTFTYDLETSNYAPGDIWYPTVADWFGQYTARLELLVGKKNQVRAMGKLVSNTEGDRGTTAVYVIDKPTKMITFATAEDFEEETIDVKGIPRIVSFGATHGFGMATRMRNAGADVANSMQFFQNLLGDPITGDTFYVTSITGNHGQAFDGFLHLSEYSYEEHPGASELFRAHEVAHEWFGHRVGWRSYRDQWLSESLAEYASMMFVQATVKGGDKYFNEILMSYDGIVKGNMAGGFSKFNRPWLIERSATARGRLGPIGDGFRASTGDIPQGYEIQAYCKGPLVIHMLRSLLGQKTGNDNVFVQILRDWVHDYSGKNASTADFEKIVEKDAPGDWSWFFHDWIDRADIPTIRWSYKVEPDGAKYKLTMTIKRSDAPKDFTMYVPVRIEADGGKRGTLFVAIKDDEQTITRELPIQPRSVVFAPDHALLANIRRE